MSMLNVYILYITYILSLTVYLLVSASVFLTFVHISKVSNHFSYNILKWDRSHDYKCAISKIKIFREKISFSKNSFATGFPSFSLKWYEIHFSVVKQTGIFCLYKVYLNGHFVIMTCIVLLYKYCNTNNYFLFCQFRHSFCKLTFLLKVSVSLSQKLIDRFQDEINSRCSV